MSELRKAIKEQADELKRRADWQQKMFELHTQAALKSQATAEQLRIGLEATNLTLDALRAEYRKIEGNNNGSKDST